MRVILRLMTVNMQMITVVFITTILLKMREAISIVLKHMGP